MSIRTGSMEPCSVATSHTCQLFFTFLVVSPPTSTSCFQLQVPYQPTQMLHLLVPPFKFLVPSVKIITPQSTRHCPIRLKQPFSKARLPFLLLILPIFVSLLPFFPSSGSPKKPSRATFSVTPWLTSRHFPMHASAEPQLCRRFSQTTPIVRAKNIVNELSLFLGSQPICIVGFGFPTMGNSLPGDPSAHSRLYELHSFSFLSCSPYCSYYYPLLSSLTRIANPFTSHTILPFIAGGKWRCYDYFLISLMWMGVQFHRF